MFYNFGILWKKSGILVSHYPPAGPDSLCSIELLMATDQGGVQFWREITNMKLNKNLIALKEQKKAATKAEKGTASSMWKLTTNGFLVLIKTGVTRESTVMIFNNFFSARTRPLRSHVIFPMMIKSLRSDWLKGWNSRARR